MTDFENTLKKLFIDSQIYVALMGTALALFFMLENNEVHFSLLRIILIFYFSGYAYTEFQYSSFIKWIILLNLIIAGACLYLFLYQGNISLIYKLALTSLLGIAYDSKFLKQRFRKIPLLKIFYVGAVWGLINAWIISATFHWGAFLITLFFIAALLLPFDIRDRIKDKDKVLTFPNLMGTRNTKLLAFGLLFLTGLLGWVFLDKIGFLAFILSIVVTGILLFPNLENKRDIYFSFGIESCSALPLIFWGIASFYF